MFSIKQRVERRGRWIAKQQRFFASLPPPLPPRQYRSGESLRYLGRQYRLRVVEQREAEVKLKRGELWVALPDRQDTENLVKRWYRQRAEAVLAERLAHCLRHTSRFAIPPPATVTLRRMKTRWGSCSKQGRITLNTELIQASKECIDYVILHELCHLVERNHSPAYYRLLARVAPQWRTLRQTLLSSPPWL